MLFAFRTPGHSPGVRPEPAGWVSGVHVHSGWEGILMTLNGRSITGAPVSPSGPVVTGPPQTGGESGGAAGLRAPLVLTVREERAPLPALDSAEMAGAGAAASTAGYLDRLVVRSRSRILFLDVAEVAWLEAYGNYVRFHTPGEVFTVRGTLSSFEQQLDPARFVRIHRSVIVNRDVVRELHSRRTGDFTLVTSGGESLTLSRNFRNRVPELRRRMAS